MTRLKSTWKNMRDRCNNKNRKDSSSYSDRGITVCDEWNDYSIFKSWALSNGYTDSLFLDRIDNDLGYSPSNCRFVTMQVQGRNTRKIYSHNTSGFRGVTLQKTSGRWRAQIRVDNKKIHIAICGTALEAALAYDYYVLKNNLEHTRNFNSTEELWEYATEVKRDWTSLNTMATTLGLTESQLDNLFIAGGQL